MKRLQLTKEIISYEDFQFWFTNENEHSDKRLIELLNKCWSNKEIFLPDIFLQLEGNKLCLEIMKKNQNSTNLLQKIFLKSLTDSLVKDEFISNEIIYKKDQIISFLEYSICFDILSILFSLEKNFTFE